MNILFSYWSTASVLPFHVLPFTISGDTSHPVIIWVSLWRSRLKIWTYWFSFGVPSSSLLLKIVKMKLCIFLFQHSWIKQACTYLAYCCPFASTQNLSCFIVERKRHKKSLCNWSTCACKIWKLSMDMRCAPFSLHISTSCNPSGRIIMGHKRCPCHLHTLAHKYRSEMKT